jgi:hypothetical protein
MRGDAPAGSLALFDPILATECVLMPHSGNVFDRVLANLGGEIVLPRVRLGDLQRKRLAILARGDTTIAASEIPSTEGMDQNG